MTRSRFLAPALVACTGLLASAAAAQPTIELGACCLPQGECIVAPENICTLFGGTFQGVDTDCETVTCTPAPPPTECDCDWNGDGSLNSADISAFLTDWLSQEGDFDGDGMNNSADIRAFILCFVRGC